MSPENPHRTGVGLDHWGEAFPSTHWSVMLGDSAASRSFTLRFLEKFSHHYWYPLYAYLRKRGHTSQDAQDLIQGFMCKMAENDGLKNASPECGRFRSFLLAALKHFENDVRKRDTAQKRGSGKPLVSIEEDLAEERYRGELADNTTPEKLFDRGWATALLQDVIDQLRQEYCGQGKANVFEVLNEFLTVKPDKGTYPGIAESLGVSEGNVRVLVNRMRGRYKAILTSTITDMVGSPAEVDEELRYLFSTFSG